MHQFRLTLFRGFGALLRDERGFILSAELVLILTIGVLAMIVGVHAVAKSLNAELIDVAQAFSNFNQSYFVHGFAYVCPRVGLNAATGGSGFFDGSDACDCSALSFTGPGTVSGGVAYGSTLSSAANGGHVAGGVAAPGGVVVAPGGIVGSGAVVAPAPGGVVVPAPVPAPGYVLPGAAGPAAVAPGGVLPVTPLPEGIVPILPPAGPCPAGVVGPACGPCAPAQVCPPAAGGPTNDAPRHPENDAPKPTPEAK